MCLLFFFFPKKVRIKCYLILRKLSLNVQSAEHSSEKELCGLGNPFICKDGRTFRRTCLRRTMSGRTERRRTEYKDWDPWSLDYKPVVQKQYLPSKTKSVTREGE